MEDALKRRSKLNSKAVRRALPRRARPPVSLPPDPFARFPPFRSRARARRLVALSHSTPHHRAAAAVQGHVGQRQDSAAASARRAPVRRRAAGAPRPGRLRRGGLRTVPPTLRARRARGALPQRAGRRADRRARRRRFVSRARGVALVAQDFAATPRLSLGRSGVGLRRSYSRVEMYCAPRGFVATRAKGGGTRSPPGGLSSGPRTPQRSW